MDQENPIIICKQCHTKNRVPANRLKDRPVCGKCKSLLISPQDRVVKDITDHTFDMEVIQNPLPVLVDCWAPWCGPCKIVGPVLDELAWQYAGRVKIVKLNVDENPVTASRYGIQSIPTILLFNQGAKVGQLIGAQPKADIERHIRSIF